MLHADGVLGLGPDGSDRLLTQMKKAGKIKRKVFSFSIDGGVFTLGGYDAERFGFGSKPQLDWLSIL